METALNSVTTEVHIPSIAFETIGETLRNTKLPLMDLVVGIGSGGVVLAAMVAYKLRTPMITMWLNYRDINNIPVHTTPQLSHTFSFPSSAKSVLIVDDVAVSGKTLTAAKRLIPCPNITTLVLKGDADIVLFPEVKSCIQWPWNPSKSTSTS